MFFVSFSNNNRPIDKCMIIKLSMPEWVFIFFIGLWIFYDRELPGYVQLRRHSLPLSRVISSRPSLFNVPPSCLLTLISFILLIFLPYVLLCIWAIELSVFSIAFFSLSLSRMVSFVFTSFRYAIALILRLFFSKFFNIRCSLFINS